MVKWTIATRDAASYTGVARQHLAAAAGCAPAAAAYQAALQTCVTLRPALYLLLEDAVGRVGWGASRAAGGSV